MSAFRERRQSVGAVALSLLLVASLLAVAVPTGVATSHSSDAQLTSEDTEHFDGEGQAVETEDGDTFVNGAHVKDGLLYVVTDADERVVVYNTDFDIVDEHDLEHSVSGITYFDGEWVLSNWDDDTLHTYDDEFDELATHDLETNADDDDRTPWNIDTLDDELYVTDGPQIQVLDTDFEQTRTIDTDRELIQPLEIVGDSLFVMENGDDETVYELDTDGEELETYQATPETDYEMETRTLYLFDGEWYIHDIAGDGEPYRFPAADAGTDTLSGTLTDQWGEPVPNATISATGVTDVGFDDLEPDALEREADALLTDLEDPLPEDFDPEFDLDSHTDADTTYTLVHEPGDWDIQTTTVIDSTLEEPRLTVDDDQDVLISLWDPSEDGGWLDNQVDQSFPGATTEGEITIEQLAPTGETTDSRTLETEPVAETERPLRSSIDHHAVRTSLPPGVYHASPDDGGAGYVFTVGEPSDLASAFADDLRDEADTLTERAERIADLEADETLVTETTTTDNEGAFDLEIDDRAERVSLQPLATPDQEPLPADAGLEDLQALESDVFMPTPETATATHAPPDEDIDLEVYRAPTLPYEDLENFEDRWADLESEFLNDSLADLEGWDQRLEEITGEQQADLVDTLETFFDDDELETSIDIDLESDLTGDDSEDLETLREQLESLEDELADVGDGGTYDDGDIDGLLDLSFPVPDSVDREDIVVLAHTSSGETKSIDSEYWTLESEGLFGGEALTLTENPFDGDTGVVTLDVHVADDGEYGTGSGTAPVPDFDGDLPGVDALAVSTLEPGVGERVTIDAHLDSEHTPASVADVERFDPDGENASVDLEGDRVTFSPDSEGVHQLRLTIQTPAGDEFVVSERLRVGEDSSSADRATLRAGSSPLGHHAVVTDDLETASVDRSGDTVEIDADAADLPGELHVQLERVLSGSDHEIDVTVTEDDRTPDRHVSVFAHMGPYQPEDAVHWQGDNPITVDGDTRYGDVLEKDTPVIVTYTDEDGSLEGLSVSEDADLTDRVSHWISIRTPTPAGWLALTVALAFPRWSRLE